MSARYPKTTMHEVISVHRHHPNWTARQIAEALGCRQEYVRAVAYRNKLTLTTRRQRPSERNGRTVVFPRDVLDRLKPHADQRGISINELLRRLADEIVDADLVTSILDDQETET